MFLPVTLFSAAMLLGACSDSYSESPSVDTTADTATASETASAAGESAAAFNDADVTFAKNMIPHHQQAVEMSVLALEDARGASAEVKDLATRIQGAQQPEIDLMSGWLKAWGKEDDASNGGHSDHSSMEGMEGMMSADEMKSLAAANGESFDKSWMEMMVRHHEGALVMAKAVQTEGANPEVKDLAGKVIASQEAEIAEMNAALGK